MKNLCSIKRTLLSGYTLNFMLFYETSFKNCFSSSAKNTFENNHIPKFVLAVVFTAVGMCIEVFLITLWAGYLWQSPSITTGIPTVKETKGEDEKPLERCHICFKSSRYPAITYLFTLNFFLKNDLGVMTIFPNPSW